MFIIFGFITLGLNDSVSLNYRITWPVSVILEIEADKTLSFENIGELGAVFLNSSCDNGGLPIKTSTLYVLSKGFWCLSLKVKTKI